jgi:hypothetical protein
MRQTRAASRRGPGAPAVWQDWQVAGFDAEGYLRLAGEQWLREGGRIGGPPVNPVLAAAAAALVAVNAITTAAAQAVIGEYDPALTSRRDRACHAQHDVHMALAADAAWIEILGERVKLTAKPAGIETWAEPLPAQDLAVQHLWERVATLDDFHDPRRALDATIAALVAAGALQADDSRIGAARAALAVLRPDGAAPAESPIGAPEPWRSLLARWGQTGGPVGTVTVGTITPSFDGITAAVITLKSRDEHFGITVELVPGARTGLPYYDLPDQQHLTWWAADDLGNHYLGEQGSWDPGDDRSQGAIGFWPALDKRASRVDLVPTGTAARAVIRVPLPWTEHN